MSLSAVIFAAALAAPVAAPIQVVGAAVRTPPAVSACVQAAGGSDIECTLNLAQTSAGRTAERIIIRTQWAPACAARAAQVVTLTPATTKTPDLPVVEHIGAKACAS